MNKLVLLFAGLLSLNIFGAVLEVGDTVPEMCWKDAQDQDVCLSQYPEKVRVLLYNTGWCPSCNEEMEQLIPQLDTLKDEPLIFMSLSAQGFTSAVPDAQFLKEWKEKHSIPFPVLASPKDPGKKFFEPPYSIPAVVILGKNGAVAYKEVGPEVDAILTQVRLALAAEIKPF